MKKLGMKRSQLAVPVARFVHVDTAHSKENHEFELSVAQPSPNTMIWQKCFKLRPLEDPLTEVCRYIQILLQENA